LNQPAQGSSSGPLRAPERFVATLESEGDLSLFDPTPEAVAGVPRVQWWAVVFGANLGGSITSISPASTIVAVTIMKKYGLKITFLEFVKIKSLLGTRKEVSREKLAGFS